MTTLSREADSMSRWPINPSPRTTNSEARSSKMVLRSDMGLREYFVSEQRVVPDGALELPGLCAWCDQAVVHRRAVLRHEVR